MRRFNMTIRIINFAAILLISSPAAATPVNFMLEYERVPVTVAWVEKDLKSTAQEPMEETMTLGTLGLRLGVGVPVYLDPFTLCIETGLDLHAGNQTFAHSQLVRNTEGASREQKNDGDFTEWSITTVPLIFKLRFLPPTDGITLGGDMGFGPVLLDISTGRTISQYDPSDNLQLREKEKWDEAKVALAMEINGGVVVPVSESLRVELMAAVMWMSKVPAGRVRDYPRPTAVYGYAADNPAAPVLQVGGIGYGARVGLTVGL